MSIKQLAYALLGLIISGGMLIPGNIPNIIAAGKLKIKNKEWIAVGVPVGVSVAVSVGVSVGVSVLVAVSVAL